MTPLVPLERLRPVVYMDAFGRQWVRGLAHDGLPDGTLRPSCPSHSPVEGGPDNAK